MAAEAVQSVTLAIILGTLLAIVYSIRILVLLERRIARIDHHIELMALTILKDEKALLSEEKRIETLVQTPRVVPVRATKKRAKKTTAKKSTRSGSNK